MRNGKTSKEVDTVIKSIPLFLKGSLIAALITMLLQVLVAFLFMQFLLDPASTSIVVPIMKMIGAAVAAIIVIRKSDRLAWLNGILAGVVYAVLAYIVYSIITGDFSITLGLLVDTLVCALSGMLTGMIYRATRG